MSKVVARFGVPVLAVLALAGCGSSNSSSTASTTTPTTSAPGPNGANAAIEAEVPAAIKSKGTLLVATEAQYAPNEFVANDGHTIIGMDPDIMKALGEVMGLKVKMVNSTFNTIIPGLAAGKYDIGASSFTDTKEREKTVDFVDYFTAGVSFFTKASANAGVSTIADICGKTVAVEKGTVEQEEASEQSGKCTKEGKKAPSVLSFPGQSAANLALASGRAEVAMADSPVAAYQVKQSGGNFKLVGETYGDAPYGLAIPKSANLTKPILAALKVIIANGTYETILTKWGLTSGALKTPSINGATS
jgi:polar amino acid transport system substrate-binding protein